MVVGLDALELSPETGRRLRLLLETGVQVVEIDLKVGQRDAQLVTLLEEKKTNISATLVRGIGLIDGEAFLVYISN